MNSKTKRCAVVVTGAPQTGKKVVCQRAAGYANLVPYLHVSDESIGFLQFARTVATWFRFMEIEEVRDCADTVLSLLEMKRWSRAHDECVELVNLAVRNELQACFLIDRIHLLDDFSLSLIRECLLGRSRRHRSLSRSSTSILSQNSSRSTRSGIETVEDGDGKICFLCIHVPLYSCKAAEHVVHDITRSHKSLSIPILNVGAATKAEMQTMTAEISGIVPSKRFMNAAALACGHCAGYYAERSGGLRNLSSQMWNKGEVGFVEIDDNFEWTIPLGSRRNVISLPVTGICGNVAIKFSTVFDVLPPLFQTFCKILAVSSRTTFFKLPRALMWNALNDLIADGVEYGVYNIVIDEMVEMDLLKIDVHNDEEVLSFRCPALGDIAFDVCTPVQLRSIGCALIERLQPHTFDGFVIPFVLANLHDLVGDEYKLKEENWIVGYKRFLQDSCDLDANLVADWKEMITDELHALGCANQKAIVGCDSSCEYVFRRSSISDTMMLLKQYHSPIAFGPHGLSLSVITANLYFLCGEFHGVPTDRIVQARKDFVNGCSRYLQEVTIIETFLSKHGFNAAADMLENERDMINDIKLPANNMKDLDHKASILYNKFIATNVVDRINRIHRVVEKLRELDAPNALQIRDDTIRLAYKAITSTSTAGKQYADRAQDALMVMATRNWKAKPIPESLPSYHLLTLSRIRNKVMKQLSDTELLMWKHQQSYIDLEAFFVITTLLQEAQHPA